VGIKEGYDISFIIFKPFCPTSKFQKWNLDAELLPFRRGV
jgi:hypothetical protein